MPCRSWDLTPAQKEQAQQLRAQGFGQRKFMSPRRIAKMMGVGEAAVRRALGLENQKCGMLGEQRLRCIIKPRIEVPSEVLLERERRMNEPRTFSQVAFGDPPFSQSALAGHALGRS